MNGFGLAMIALGAVWWNHLLATDATWLDVTLGLGIIIFGAFLIQNEKDRR